MKPVEQYLINNCSATVCTCFCKIFFNFQMSILFLDKVNLFSIKTSILVELLGAYVSDKAINRKLH